MQVLTAQVIGERRFYGFRLTVMLTLHYTNVPVSGYRAL